MKDPYLTKNEKCHLARLRAEAFAHLDALGLIDAEADTKTARQRAWAAEQLQDVCGIDTLTKARRSQFLEIKAHFLSLLGRDDESLNCLIRAGKASGRSDIQDTIEARERGLWLIRDALAKHHDRPAAGGPIATHIDHNGGPITESYIIQIARTQLHKGAQFRDLTLLNVHELRRLLYTAKNRIRSREGRPRQSNTV